MRRLYPESGEVDDLAAAYSLDDGVSEHLRVNMVSSVDGAATIDGRVGRLTSPADQSLLHVLRALADVVLVGAGTIRAEGYGPLSMSSQWKKRRLAGGQAAAPPYAVLTRGLDLDLDAPLFTQAVTRPVILTCAAAPAARRRAAAEVADVVVVDGEDLDLRLAVAELRERGLRRVLSEGGPGVLSALFVADLVDELCLAIAPTVVAGDAPRITSGPRLPAPQRMRLAHVLEDEDFLFLRYRRP